jgi:hypothetical protein
MAWLKQVATFVRWRFVPVRYAGKLARMARKRERATFRTPKANQLETDGHAVGPTISPNMLAAIRDIFVPRAEKTVPMNNGHPFKNLVQVDDFSPENPLMQYAFSAEILDVADDYFGGRFIIDSIQVLYSWPTGNRVAESQMWHRDYGDSRTLHCVAYLNDVRSAVDGPFVFVDKHDTKRIRAAPLIRRISDTQFERELGDGGTLRTFTGKSGEAVFIDPSACYHYGSRCKTGRLAIFVTFFSDTPFVDPTAPIVINRHRLFDVAKAIRPDLSENYLARLLQI